MRFKFYLVLAFFLLFSSSIDAQDLHFTQYHLSPLNVNPALAGAYYGSYRIGGIYRDQYRTVNNGTSKPFQTASVFVDSPIIGGLRKQDWIGVGVNMYFDQAGEAFIRNLAQVLNAAYHLGLDKDQNNVLSIGVQFGSVQRRFDKNKGITPFALEEDLGAGQDPFLASLVGGSGQGGGGGGSDLVQGGYTHLGIGTMLTSSLGKTTDLRIGANVAHFLRPGQAIATAGQFGDRKLVRTTAFMTLYSDLGDKFTLIPSIFFQNAGKSNELVIQTRGSLMVNEEKQIAVSAGLGARVVNAADLQIMVGMDIKDIRVGLAYDINLASFTPATNGSSGFELGVTYLGKIYKKPDVEPILICPRL